MTHPFHPLAGWEFEFVKRRRNWRQDRVYFYDGVGELVSLPAEWTDVWSRTRSWWWRLGRLPFHVAGLLGLSDLIARLSAERLAETSRSVKQTTP